MVTGLDLVELQLRVAVLESLFKAFQIGQECFFIHRLDSMTIIYV